MNSLAHTQSKTRPKSSSGTIRRHVFNCTCSDGLALRKHRPSYQLSLSQESSGVSYRGGDGDTHPLRGYLTIVPKLHRTLALMLCIIEGGVPSKPFPPAYRHPTPSIAKGRLKRRNLSAAALALSWERSRIFSNQSPPSFILGNGYNGTSTPKTRKVAPSRLQTPSPIQAALFVPQ